MRLARLLTVMFACVSVGLAAWSQCGTLEQASSSIVALAMIEMRSFEETYGVIFDWGATRVSTRGEMLVIGIPVVEPYAGFSPGDFVAGYVIRGYPGHPDGAYALRLADGFAILLVNAWGGTVREIPVCDPRLQDCNPAPHANVLPIAKFHPRAEEKNCCYDCYVFCFGWPPNQTCEDHCSWTCPCPD